MENTFFLSKKVDFWGKIWNFQKKFSNLKVKSDKSMTLT